MSDFSTGRSHPGQRHVRSRHRTTPRSSPTGRYPGSGATPVGTFNGLSVAVAATSRTLLGGQHPKPGQIPRLDHWCRRGWPARPAHESPRTPPRPPHRARRRPGSPQSALAGQRGLTARQRPTRIGAALLLGARIVAHTPWPPTHPGADPALPRLRHRLCPTKPAMPSSLDSMLDIPVVVHVRRHPHPGRIELGHPQIHPVTQLRPGQLHPLLGMPGDRLIQARRSPRRRRSRCAQ